MKNIRGTRARLFQKAALSTLLKEIDTIKKLKVYSCLEDLTGLRSNKPNNMLLDACFSAFPSHRAGALGAGRGEESLPRLLVQCWC